MPHIYEETMPIETMRRVKKHQVCAICGGKLDILYDLTRHQVYLACHADQNHEGIAKPYENREYNIATRRGYMTTEIGEQKTRALERYSGVTSLTRDDAGTIIATLWPEADKASPAEVYKAVSICVRYGLNPLMRHLYLIPFWNKEKKRYDYVAVMGIGATRLIASRKHAYSYIDDSPRVMSETEQVKVFGEVAKDSIVAITILKDARTGATARGYGKWPVDKQVQGSDKGNSKANMAFIRSERQALDRLYPADMPQNVEVVDERYEVTVEPLTQPPPGDAPAEAVKESSAQPTPEATKSPAESSVTAPAEPAPPAAKPKAESQGTSEDKPNLDLAWLKDSLAKLQGTVPKQWGTAMLVSRMQKMYGINGTDAVEMAQQLDKGKLAHFCKAIQESLDML